MLGLGFFAIVHSAGKDCGSFFLAMKSWFHLRFSASVATFSVLLRLANLPLSHSTPPNPDRPPKVLPFPQAFYRPFHFHVNLLSPSATSFRNLSLLNSILPHVERSGN